jgi:hypothetical protein
MEWLVAIYLVVGVVKTLSLLGNPDAAVKPVWMTSERNPLVLAIAFAFHSLLWPFAGPRR